MIVSYNLSTGFNNDFGSYNNWKFAISSDIYKFKNQNIRIGIALGGKYKSSLGMGYGIKLGPIQFDIASAIMVLPHSGGPYSRYPSPVLLGTNCG